MAPCINIIVHIIKFEIHFTGTRIGQASECFVYWKDALTNDTWGLNFTSPIDAKQFRECCVSIRMNNKEEEKYMNVYCVLRSYSCVHITVYFSHLRLNFLAKPRLPTL